MDALVIIVAMIALAVGAGIMYAVNQNMLKKKAADMLKEAELKGELLLKNRQLEAKEKFLQLKSEHEKEVSQRNQQVATQENKIKQKEQTLAQKLEQSQRKDTELDQIKQTLERQQEVLTKKKEELEKQIGGQVKQLEKIAGLTADEAKAQLVETLTSEARTNAMTYIKDIVDEAKLTAGREAKKVILNSIQRTAAEHAIENSVSVFNIDSDEMKGRIIGREGRNIRALE
nr:DUF3552 domain-containing protein [Bacteroidia bacterium]